MDPVTAFGLVVNVCQAVEVGIQVAKSCKKLSVGGSDFTVLEEQNKYLSDSTKLLQDDIARVSNEGLQRPCEKDLLQVSQRCSETAESLQHEAQKLNIPSGGRGRKRRIVKVALRSSFGSSTISHLQARLDGYRGNLVTHILISLRRDSVLHDQQIAAVCDRLKVTSELSKDIQASIADIEGRIALEGALIRSHISDETTRLQAELTKALTERKEADLHHCLWTQLAFPEMDVRRENVEPAHKNTFQWIFSTTYELGKWDNFKHWLEKGAKVYWIHGKPGAGKSTLMRFILEDRRTEEALQVGSDGSLLVLSFFFWRPGREELQKNVLGLQRALLCQILKRHPECAPMLAVCLDIGEDIVSVSTTLSNAKVSLALRRVLEILTGEEKINCCIFIDGLDEAEEKFQQSLVSLIQELSGMKRIKICISSRPEAVFYYNFARCPRLAVQNLTGTDILGVIEDWLSRHNFNDEGRILSILETNELMSLMIKKAEGVFLWIKLALASLYRGIVQYESFPQLQARLDALPSELKELFGHLLDRIEAEHVLESVRYIKLLQASDDARCGTVTFDLALVNIHEQGHANRQFADREDVQRRCQQVEKAVLLRTAGLLEIGEPFAKAQFFRLKADAHLFRPFRCLRFVHRTAADFLTSEKHRFTEIMEQDSEWIAARELAEAQILCMRDTGLTTPESGPQYRFGENNEYFTSCPKIALRFLRAAEKQSQESNVEVYNNLISECARMVHTIAGGLASEDPQAWRVALGDQTTAEKLLPFDDSLDDLFTDAPASGVLVHHSFAQVVQGPKA
ncbi:MAG: hypothetical protein Q9162_007250 [Coniocarpon cinnabarinum]